MTDNFEICEYDEVTSTNLVAIDIARNSNRRNVVIIAKRQTAGRGRCNRSWISPEGNLYCSILLHQQDSLNCELSFVTAVAINTTLKQYLPHYDIQNKWPNDVLINAKKISGCLIETESKKDWVVVGIGININNAPLQESTAIIDFTHASTDVKSVLNVLLDEVRKIYTLWTTQGFGIIRKLWLKNAYKINELITVSTFTTQHCGTFIGIDLNGNLLLKQISNEVQVINFGEIVPTFST